MDTPNWLPLVSALLCAGGAGYLIIESIINRRNRRAKDKGEEISNAHSVMDLYKEIDVIVEAKTQPILDNQQKLMEELNDIKAHWCCYRSGCPTRMLYKEEDDTDSCQGEE